MILDWDETRDVAQETLVSAYEALARFDDRGKFQSWLFRIGARKAIDLIRRRKRHPELRVAASEGELEAVAGRGRNDPGVERNELTIAIQQAVGELPADQRTAFVLSEYEDWSSREIAGVIGGSEKRVEMQLYRARAFLREKLKKFL
jgi:RNA polymerase sigma-70 factor (ECF subfamily)